MTLTPDRIEEALAKGEDNDRLLAGRNFDPAFWEEARAALREALTKVDCGGVNCGRCQQCLTAQFGFAEIANRELQAALREAQAENARLREELDEAYGAGYRIEDRARVAEATASAIRKAQQNLVVAWRERYQHARFEVAQAMSAHYDEADESDDDGSHVGFARHHRAIASGLSEALLILDRYAKADAALAVSPPADEAE